jgi:hypothetical protein
VKRKKKNPGSEFFMLFRKNWRYLQVHSFAGLPHPLQTLFLMGAPHFLQGVHPHV